MSGVFRRHAIVSAALVSALSLTGTAAYAVSSDAAPAAADAASAGEILAPQSGHHSRGGKVTIRRDSYGVPHVFADTTYGLFRGYGYSVAQDRLFQMEMSRRSTQGTVSEVLGADYLALDKDTRTGMSPDSIKRQIRDLPRRDRDILEGYADGMNEHIDKVLRDRRRLMPKQFNDFGFTPARWTSYDVAMVWVGTMANRYSDSTAEIPNYQMLQSLIAKHGETTGRQLFDQMQWLEDPTAPTTVPRSGAINRRPQLPKSDDASNQLRPLEPGVRDAGVEMMRRAGAGDGPNAHPEASNVWITGKARSRNANSILLNGPQFQWFNPSYVYGIGLHGAGWDFAGSTPFAYPSVIFGTNSKISWGATAGPLNLVDVYQETLNPADQRQYKFNGAWRNMSVRQDTIKVKGQADVRHDVLRTVHGPVTSVDTANNTAYSKRRSWEGAEVQSLIAWAKVPKATSFRQFQGLAAQFATTINWYYADVRGNIGYISPGRLPDRPAKQDMRIPANGDGSMEWEGFLPPTANPVTYNPTQGFIANWNNQSGPGQNNDYGNWSYVDRAQEIFAAFTSGKQKFTPEDIWELNKTFSFADLNIRYLREPLAQAVADLPANDTVRVAAEQLIAWDGQTRDENGDGVYDGTAPGVMRAWLPLLFEAVLADDLPANVYQSYSAGFYAQGAEERGSIRPFSALKLVHNALAGEDSGVEQTYDFFNGVEPDKLVLESFAEALDELAADPSAQQVAVARHVYRYRNFLGVPQANPEEQLAGPVYMNRGTANHMAVLRDGRDRLCIVSPPGQSGFVSPTGAKSPHYDDQLELFANFQCRDEKLRRQDVLADTESVTVLR